MPSKPFAAAVCFTLAAVLGIIGSAERARGPMVPLAVACLGLGLAIMVVP